MKQVYSGVLFDKRASQEGEDADTIVQPMADGAPREMCHSLIVSTDVKLQDSFMPPVNVQSLRDINIEALSQSLGVRHDIVLDLDSRVKSKQSAVDSPHYWQFLELELEEMLTNRQNAPCVQSRLHAVLSQIRDMLHEIYPASRRLSDCLAEHFDVDFMMACIRMSEFNPVAWIQTVTRAVKANCAPRRDHLLDELVKLTREGKYVPALQAFLDVNHVMHMDLINHALCERRSDFAKTLVTEERSYFMEQFHSYQMFPNNLKQLMRDMIAEKEDPMPTGEIYRRMFRRMMSTGCPIPETFILDRWRLELMQVDLQNLNIMTSVNVLARYLLRPLIPSDDRKVMFKERLRKLVTNEQATIVDVSEDVVFEVNSQRVIHGLHAHDESMIHSLVDRTLLPEAKLFQLTFRSLLDYIDKELSPNAKANEDWIRRHGLEIVQPELDKLCAKLQALYVHNWAVFGDFYQEIHSSLLFIPKFT
jgi:hypothetical protein